jgi:colicin import membrane protein
MRFTNQLYLALQFVFAVMLIAPFARAADEAEKPPALAASGAPRDQSYASKLIATIKRNIVWSEKDEAPEALCEVEVATDNQGNIVGRKVVHSEGDPRWCTTVVRALDRTERIPQDIYGRVPPRLIVAFKSRG